MDDDKENENKTRYNLSRNDRRLLAYFLGYLGNAQTGDPAAKSQSESCLFIRKSLFDDPDERMNDKFNLTEEIDWGSYFSTPGIFPKEQAEAEAFLATAGRESTDVRECALVRAYQTFSRVYGDQLHVKPEGFLLIMLLGRYVMCCV